MKTKVLFLSTLFSVLALASASRAEFLSYTFSRHSKETLTKIGVVTARGEVAAEEREWWLSPSLNFDVYIEETKTNRSQVGIVPGVGYGVRWNPEWWVKLGSDIKGKSFLSLDVYVQGSLIDETDEFSGGDFFAIDVLPAITLIDWVSIGYGYRWKRSQHDGLDSESTPLFSLGVRKGF